VLRFGPRITPEKFKAFFCGPEGWGSLQQTRNGREQKTTVTVVEGQLAISQLRLVAAQPPQTAKVMMGDAIIDSAFQSEGGQVQLTLAKPAMVKSGESLVVSLA
jgi:hypothetical protein